MYQENFGFNTPFQIMFDSNFCKEGYRIELLHKKNVKRMMSGVVQDECKLSSSSHRSRDVCGTLNGASTQ